MPAPPCPMSKRVLPSLNNTGLELISCNETTSSLTLGTLVLVLLLLLGVFWVFLQGSRGRPPITQAFFQPTTASQIIVHVKSPKSVPPVSLTHQLNRAQELCESRGGRPGLPSLISLRFLWTKSSTEQHGARTDLLQRNNVTVNFRHVGVSFVVVVVVYRVRGATSSSAIAAEHGNTGGYRTNLCFPFRAAVFVRLFIRFKSLHCLLPVLSCV